MTSHPIYDRASLYEAAFAWDAAPEAEFYGRVLGPGRILDVGCGTGRVLAALAACGREVTGLELSPAMAGIASARGLDVVVGDMRTFRLPRPADGAFSHLSTFRYLASDGDVAAHLDAMAAALPRAGSRYAIDHDLVGRDFDTDHPGQTWHARGPGGVAIRATWRALGAPVEGSGETHGARFVREEFSVAAGADVFRHDELLRAWTADELSAAVARHGAFAVDAWFAAPFEIAAPFRPVPWTPCDFTGRVVTVLRRV